MIKLIVEIKEDKKEESENLSITGVEVHVTEIGKKATEGERYCSKLLKDRMHIERREEIINMSCKSKKEIVENLLKSLENL